MQAFENHRRVDVEILMGEIECGGDDLIGAFWR